ncbi:MAG: pyruvate dehydrogenase (acetyl-transferring), homodimeric type [Candidatus Marinimicrobia bacterium]|nr:pyruvate dehydrogenase (acetyl-transferring), homodimeric type [Candidatus Neomarinimicrobiota bacterium]MCF7828067.1 pyruvate dehydrogenase (acetyl-transferring), homodimeric type [Candidatus Neomarinimicrobiota bacterium]MCF7879758.1 pyruvate dehydrogenase (acetyl-transferring), homodimeric type [Candidatus Neomarinimicrobiota bacterium]
MSNNNSEAQQYNEVERREWLESLDYVLEHGGPDRVKQLLQVMENRAYEEGVRLPFTANTPYVNTIHVDEQPPFPGSREIERRIKSLCRWNAMAMVVRANKEEDGIGGHISTYASSATLYEVGFNHFFRASEDGYGGDQIYFQGHASPGMYARAFLEGRLTETQLRNFRRELREGGGVSSYPHPWLMPDFWQFPTVSMGLGPIQAIYHARFIRYLEDRGLKEPDDHKVWAFLGDGETDEPETLGAISLASRENLDNLIFVINCNLQRLDGPVRGNSKIVQELEAVFRGAGWNVIKALWGSQWDPLFEKDEDGVLSQKLLDIVDGESQKHSIESGDYIREHVFGGDQRLQSLVEDMSDEELEKMKRGGHDPEKVYAAYKAAVEHKGSPTVILAKTVKGYGLGESGEGKNITHQQKKLNEEEMKEFRSRFAIPLSDDDVAKMPFYKPDDDSPEMEYLHERRKKLGGYLPKRNTEAPEPLDELDPEIFKEFHEGTEDRDVATTMAFVRILAKLLRNKDIGKYIVPIVPDEARTFGMEALFRQVGIYSHSGQLYEPVDADTLLYYKEAKDGQILEEGITEAGSMSSFIAAGTAYSNHGINTIPFFIYYSMFGFQRIGDLIWAAGDSRARGFMVGGTAGRTTLNGEGLQHQDGHSHLLAYPLPNLRAYDPAFAFELAVIIEHGIKEMYVDQKNVFYYLTVENEPYPMPAMPDGAEEGIIKGLYKFKTSGKKKANHHAQLMGSGAIMNKVIKAQEILEEDYDVAANVWSVTSYKELHRDALDAQRWNMLHPENDERVPYVTECFSSEKESVYVAASDYMKALPESIASWIPGRLVSLGTDGFGRSDSRQALRDFFEVDERYIVVATLYGLAKEGKIEMAEVKKAIDDLDIDPEKLNPMIS